MQHDHRASAAIGREEALASDCTISAVVGANPYDCSAHASAAALQIAKLVTMKVQEQMSEAMRYGGMMRPRGS